MATDAQSIRARHSNRQYALMQKIMMLEKPWPQSGLRSWELDVGEWERASGTALADAVKYTVMINMPPIFLRNSLQLGTYANSTALRAACCSGVTPLETLERIRPRHLEMERVQMMTGCKLTLSSKVRERAKVKTNTREEIARPARPTRALQTSTRARTVANLNIGKKTAGIWVGERMTIPPTEILAKARVNTQVMGKANTWTPSETSSNVSYLSQDPSVVGELLCISIVDPWIMGVQINSVSSVRRQAGAEYLLLDSGAQLHACPISYPRHKIPLPDPGIHTASGERLQHDGRRLVRYELPEGRTIRVLFHVCAVQKPILSLGRLAQQEY